MIVVSRSRAYSASADEIWRVIGDFHDLAGWHPAVAGQTADGDLRTLDVGGGATIVERLIGQDGTAYAYEIVSGPLPVEEYRSVLAIAPAASGSVVTWSSTFLPTGDGAAGAIAGIYESGMGALAKRFAQAG